MMKSIQIILGLIFFFDHALLHGQEKNVPLDIPMGWRGDGTGIFRGVAPVVKWDGSTGENILWKTPMPAMGTNSPVAANGRVFTTADPDILLCLDAESGQILWQRAHGSKNEPGKKLKFGGTYGWAYPTPSTDGERVYIKFLPL